MRILVVVALLAAGKRPCRADTTVPAAAPSSRGRTWVSPGRHSIAYPESTFDVAVDATRVFWNTSASDIWRAPRSGGAATRVCSDAFPSFRLDGDTIYYVTSSGEVRRIPAAGGSSTRITVDADQPLDLRVDATDVYYVTHKHPTIRRVAKAGGAPSTLVDLHDRYAVIGIDGDWLYWATYGNGRGMVARRPKRGGPTTTLLAGPRRPVDLLIDEHDVFFADETDGTINRLPKSGGRPVVLARGAKYDKGLAADERFIYWHTWDRPRYAVLRVPKTGGKTDVVSSRLNMPEGIAVDGTMVYVANKGEGTIVGIPKPRR